MQKVRDKKSNHQNVKMTGSQMKTSLIVLKSRAKCQKELEVKMQESQKHKK